MEEKNETPIQEPQPQSDSEAPEGDTESLDVKALEEKAVEVLKTVYDPEIPVNIYELGLIYDLTVDENRNVKVKMTLTSPMCPVAGSLPGDVQRKLAEALQTDAVDVELVWDPAWNPSMMTEAAKLQLGML